MLRGMENHRTLVMLDPTTDQILSECSGPTATGRCPAVDSPPYVCGLHLVGVGERPDQKRVVHSDEDVARALPDRCPKRLRLRVTSRLSSRSILD
jgi:hypothetical protein